MQKHTCHFHTYFPFCYLSTFEGSLWFMRRHCCRPDMESACFCFCLQICVEVSDICGDSYTTYGIWRNQQKTWVVRSLTRQP